MCPCSGFTVPLQQPVNCMVSIVDRGVTEKREEGREDSPVSSAWISGAGLEAPQVLVWPPFAQWRGENCTLLLSPSKLLPMPSQHMVQCCEMHVLRGAGWKVSPKSSFLPPGLWVGVWVAHALHPHALQGIVSLNWWCVQNGGPKCRVKHSYVSPLCPSRSPGKPLSPQGPVSSQRKDPFAFGGGEPPQQTPHPPMLLRVKECVWEPHSSPAMSWPRLYLLGTSTISRVKPPPNSEKARGASMPFCRRPQAALAPGGVKGGDIQSTP